MREFWLLAIGLGVLLISCKKETTTIDDIEFPPIDVGEIEVESMYFVYKNNQNISDTAFYSTLNKSQKDTIRLKSSSTYEVEVFFFNEAGEDVSSYIHENGVNYMVCYFPSNSTILQLRETSLDKNEKKLGMTTKWWADSETTKTNLLEVKLKYQANTKDNLCSPGVEIIHANFAYEIK